MSYAKSFHFGLLMVLIAACSPTLTEILPSSEKWKLPR